MRTIILDTDIGNDVDDIFALIMLAKMNEFKFLGVTTVYGDTRLQAQMTRFILDKVGRVDVPVFPGESEPIRSGTGGIILRGPHVSGGFPQDELANVQVYPHTTAVDFLIEQSKLYEGELEILAIGPMTNIARAVQKDPDFSKRVKKITVMAGLIFPESNPEWLKIVSNHNGEYNTVCDLGASKIVLEAGFDLTLISLDVTSQVKFTGKHKEYFARMPFGLGKILERELEIWWNVIASVDETKDSQSNPHDPIAAVAVYDESYFTFEKGNLSLKKSYGLEGMIHFEKDENGLARIATSIRPD
ncbi:MAG: nucleoside hydrolase, partial [Spirochaetaceae bacterium]|nr:nucleoside hydrolase [Spirochaetaceae bacterium]